MTFHILDNSFTRKSNLLRKAAAYSAAVPLSLVRLARRARKPYGVPPILVNSIPKSGTHLLLQIVRSLPKTRWFGRFIAQHPSTTLRPRTNAEICAKLSHSLAGEISCGHLHYSTEVQEHIDALPILNLFIFRDPLHVIESEAHYLRTMNPYHFMAKEFSGLNATEAIDRVMYGSQQTPSLYPSFEERLAPYLGWIHSADAIAVRYENLVRISNCSDEIGMIVDRFCALYTISPDQRETLIEKARTSINPASSHTVSNRRKGILSAGDLPQPVQTLRKSMGYD